MRAPCLPEAAGGAAWIFLGSPWTLLAVYLALINLIAFCLMWSDKRRAKRAGARRIRERTLFLAAILGGSVGAIAGMWGFRHKTKHWYFVWGMPLILVIQLASALWLGRTFPL